MPPMPVTPNRPFVIGVGGVVRMTPPGAEYPVIVPIVTVFPLMPVMIELPGMPVPVRAMPTTSPVRGVTFVMTSLGVAVLPLMLPV